MKILVLNPNTSKLVTKKIADAVNKVARKDVELVVEQIEHGPEALESYHDETLAYPYILEKVEKANAEGFNAIVLAAFCDPGIEALRERSAIPIYGAEETTLSIALLLGNKFSILTEKKHKESVKRQHVRKLGLEQRFAGVRALNMGVVEIAEKGEQVLERGIELGKKMIIEDGAEVIVMGCASMAGYQDELAEKLGVPILDPVTITYKVAEGLADIQTVHSKVGLYATPEPKKWV
ncbi:MAG: aspartate/glutamate racemase family protein [Spirochaetaceae bacterium]|nr:MAG: aspartate/glutamate racemase family protein [Spirochaetaceae bacterium]